MIQVIRSSVIQNLHGEPVLTSSVHHDLVHVGVEQLFLCPLRRCQIIGSVIVFLDKVRLLWVDLVWDFVNIKAKRAISKVLAFSQVSHLLHRPYGICDGLKVGVSGQKLLLAQFDHHFGLVVEDLYFFCIKKFVLISSINSVFHVLIFEDGIERLLIFRLRRNISSVVCN